MCPMLPVHKVSQGQRQSVHVTTKCECSSHLLWKVGSNNIKRITLVGTQANEAKAFVQLQ